jgi:hypothetical protein
VLCTHGFRWFDSPGSPAHLVSQAGSLVTRRVLVADGTFKGPKTFDLLLSNVKIGFSGNITECKTTYL